MMAPQAPARTSLPNRWFIRCTRCLSVFAVDTPGRQRPFEHALCGACGGIVEHMGKLQDTSIPGKTPKPCDGRCMCAAGPQCDCKCLGVNHGKGLIASATIEEDDLVLTPPKPEKGRARAQEYWEARQALEKLRTPEDGRFLPRPLFDRNLRIRRALKDAAAARVHSTRLAILRNALAAERR